MATMTQAEYARHRGVSRQAVLKAVRAGRIVLDQDGRIDPESADASWRRNTDPSKPSNSVAGNPRGAVPRGRRSISLPVRLPAQGPSSGPDYHVSRAVRETYQAKLVRLEYELKTGKLIDAEESRRASFQDNRRVRDLLLAIPDRTAAQLAACSDPTECHRLLTAEIRRACEELSDEQSD
jgi:hypothetical protein